MSVIIRLQNLPWSATAADIRHFFQGLAIPEGGVHIVGGSAGDAFIAFSSDEDARQGMALNGGLLKDAFVKLFLSSRAEMQKIIEETRQQHLAMQATSAGTASTLEPTSPAPSMVHRAHENNPGIIGGQFHPSASATRHLNSATTTVYPGATGNSSHPSHQSFMTSLDNGSLKRPSGCEPAFYPFQEQTYHVEQPFNLRPRMQQHSNQHPSFTSGIGQLQQGFSQPVDDKRLGNSVDGFMGDHCRNVPGGLIMPQSLQERHLTGPAAVDRFSRERRDLQDSLGYDGGGDYSRGRDRYKRDRDREPFRRGRRSRSRSRSRSTSPRRRVGRDRRHRSRSASRERRRSTRDPDHDRKNGHEHERLVHLGKLAPPLAENIEGILAANQQTTSTNPEPEQNTALQLRLLDGDLTYRDLRDYFEGIRIPNKYIKMINSFDGRRFGLAYIRFLTEADKQKILSRRNGTIRSHPVQVFHVEDSTFDQAVDSYSPGCVIDAKTLSQQCLALYKFPPFGTPNAVQEAFGSISVGRVLPERNECGTATGLCYVELTNELGAHVAPQLLKDGAVICGHNVYAAFLPLEELETCCKKLERFRRVAGGACVNVASVRSTRVDTSQSPEPSTYKALSSSDVLLDSSLFRSAQKPTNGTCDQAQRGSLPPSLQPRIYITGLPSTAMERDIGDFFSDVGVIPQSIEIAYDENRMPVGAFCQFGSGQEAERALAKNGGFMGGATLNVTLVDETSDHISGTSHSSSIHSFGEMKQLQREESYPRQEDRTDSRMPLPSFNRHSAQGLVDTRQYGGNRFIGVRGGFAGSDSRGASRPPFRMRMPYSPGMQYGGPNGSTSGGSDASATPGFGAPGCVVALRNIPQTALVSDILQFFRGFQVGEKSVIRRFGPHGEPTGDARVAFSTPEEAELAVHSLQNKCILNRRIILSIV